MIVCTHCQAKNSVDSAFCKSCGREVLESDREVARQENSKLIAEGYTLLADGRTEEAELVARAAIEADAKAAGAYSLLGMCHERRDDIVAALECYEKVVELNPDSSLDKIKVTQLRNVLSRRADVEEMPNRKGALMAAAACVILVGAIGALAAVLTQPVDAQASTKGEKPKMVAEGAQAFNQIPKELTEVQQGQQYTPPQTDPSEVGNPQNQNQGQGQVPANNGNNAPDRRPNYPNLPQRNGDSQLPAVDSNSNPNGYAPLQVPDMTVEPRKDDPKPEPPPVTRPSQDDPNPVNNGGGAIQPTKSPGTIVITPSNGGGRSNGGGGQFIDDDPKASSGNALKALVRTANQQMLTGNYDSAARSLEQAKSRGGDNGSLSKKLALCYEKLGKKNDAIQAYRTAKRHLESSAEKDPTAKSQLESVNQALKNLGGG